MSVEDVKEKNLQQTPGKSPNIVINRKLCKSYRERVTPRLLTMKSTNQPTKHTKFLKQS